MDKVKERLQGILSNPYQHYLYSYPHKTAYREFPEPVPLKNLWQQPVSRTVTLYIHIPFCSSKCGYCNLFSSVCSDQARISQYVDQIIEELKAVRQFLNIREHGSPFSKVIFGGGTPTTLNDFELSRLLAAISGILDIDFSPVFFSMEISPRTITESKLAILKEYHIDRVSVGIQSFNANELRNLHRTESVQEADKALQLLVKDIPVRNLDLIYGIPAQTLTTWQASLQRFLEYKPEELYLYPLYIREKTGLYKKNSNNTAVMLAMYELARDLLAKNNYSQTSMRHFIRTDRKAGLWPEYGCQEDEMVGIGCGARSYRGRVHYSRKYAVEQANINKIIDDYLREDDFACGRYGYLLNETECKRRYILKSVLKASGLDLDAYAAKFQLSPLEEFSEFTFLLDHGFLVRQGNRVYPTQKGLMYSDAIGPLLISGEVARKMRDFKEVI